MCVVYMNLVTDILNGPGVFCHTNLTDFTTADRTLTGLYQHDSTILIDLVYLFDYVVRMELQM